MSSLTNRASIRLLIIAAAMYTLAAVPNVQAQPNPGVPWTYQCECPEGSEITQLVTICIQGSIYDVHLTWCESAGYGLVDKCNPGPTTAPDVITRFKRICFDTVVNLDIDAIYKAILCLFDPCLGNIRGWNVPNCTNPPANRFCWLYSFPPCMKQDSAGCWSQCEDDGYLGQGCCWRHRRYCRDQATGECRLYNGLPNDWECNTNMDCLLGIDCYINKADDCSPEPECESCN